MKEETVTVSALGRIVTGKTPSTKNASFFDGKYHFVTPADLNWKTYYCRKTERTVTGNAKKSYLNQFIPVNAIMVTCIGNTIGKCGLSSAECLTNQQINSIIPHDSVDSKFLYYLLVRHIDTVRAIGLGGGAATPIINKASFSKIKLRVPPRHRWSRIASILSTYDDLIENNRRRIQLLEESARQLYKEWFVRLRFPGHEHVKVVDGVPEGWEVVALGDVLILQRGFDLPAHQRKVGKYPVCASTSICGNHHEYKVLGPGVVTGRSGSLGTVLLITENFWPLNTTLWIKEYKKTTPFHARFLLESLSLSRFNGGAAVPTLNRNDVHAQKICLPPRKLVKEFTESAELTFSQQVLLEKQNRKLAKARDLLLPKLMSGEMPV